MDYTALDGTLERIEGDPRSSQSLLLYALVRSLATERGGHPFLLTKLGEMDPTVRQLAYGLMELMAEGGCAGSKWEEAVARMDRAVSRRS